MSFDVASLNDKFERKLILVVSIISKFLLWILYGCTNSDLKGSDKRHSLFHREKEETRLAIARGQIQRYLCALPDAAKIFTKTNRSIC